MRSHNQPLSHRITRRRGSDWQLDSRTNANWANGNWTNGILRRGIERTSRRDGTVVLTEHVPGFERLTQFGAAGHAGDYKVLSLDEMAKRYQASPVGA